MILFTLCFSISLGSFLDMSICLRQLRGPCAVAHRYVVLRQASAWHRDWKPAEFPQSEEEKKAAARKYGLIPSDYKAFPDDGLGLGDYPDLPKNGMANRDPYERWDFPARKRNYGEPMHWMQDFMAEFLWNPNFKPPVSWSWMIGWFGGAILLTGLAVYYNPLRVPKAYKPKQYPFWTGGVPYSEEYRNKEVHYTFSPPGANHDHH